MPTKPFEASPCRPRIRSSTVLGSSWIVGVRRKTDAISRGCRREPRRFLPRSLDLRESGWGWVGGEVGASGGELLLRASVADGAVAARVPHARRESERAAI